MENYEYETAGKLEEVVYVLDKNGNPVKVEVEDDA